MKKHTIFATFPIYYSSPLKDKNLILTGGGTALCPLPHDPITWQELRKVHKLLGRGGATESELNTILQNLEILKGGGLAKEAYPAKVDVAGDIIYFLN